MAGRMAVDRSLWKRRAYIAHSVLILLLLLMSSCAAGPNPAAGTGDGFWPGLWHGIIAPVTFVISLFNDNVNVYEVNNNGNWYDFGFILGLMISLGGAGSRARRRG